MENLESRRYLLDGRTVTWSEFVESGNSPETMAEIAEIEVGKSAILGQCDEITRLADSECDHSDTYLLDAGVCCGACGQTWTGGAS